MTSAELTEDLGEFTLTATHASIETLQEERPLTSVSISSTDLCPACPGLESCYLMRSSNLHSAYARGCRSEKARKGHSQTLAQYRASKRQSAITAIIDPDESVWDHVTPFDPENAYTSYRPDNDPAYCCECGSIAKILTPRGTAILCDECGYTTNEQTYQERLYAVAERYDKRQVKDTPAALSVTAKMDLAESVGKFLDAIDITIDQLDEPEINLGKAIASQARGLIHRLALLRREVATIGQNLTSESEPKLLQLYDAFEIEGIKAYAIIRQYQEAKAHAAIQETRAIEAPDVTRYYTHATPEPPAVYREYPNEPIPEPEIPAIIWCDMQHSVRVNASHHLYAGNGPIPEYAPTERYDFCPECAQRFQQKPDAFMAGIGYPYYKLLQIGEYMPGYLPPGQPPIELSDNSEWSRIGHVLSKGIQRTMRIRGKI